MKVSRRSFMGLVAAGVMVPVDWVEPEPDSIGELVEELAPFPAIDIPYDCLLSIDGRDFSNLVQKMELRMERDEIRFDDDLGFYPGLQRCFLDLSLYTDWASNRSAKLAIAFADRKQLLIGLKTDVLSSIQYQGRFIVQSYEHMPTNGWGDEAVSSRATLLNYGSMDMVAMQDFGMLKG